MIEINLLEPKLPGAHLCLVCARIIVRRDETVCEDCTETLAVTREDGSE